MPTRDTGTLTALLCLPCRDPCGLSIAGMGSKNSSQEDVLLASYISTEPEKGIKTSVRQYNYHQMAESLGLICMIAVTRRP
jgi:hypothetical protein